MKYHMPLFFGLAAGLANTAGNLTKFVDVDP
jgi:hypothetical protein